MTYLTSALIAFVLIVYLLNASRKKRQKEKLHRPSHPVDLKSFDSSRSEVIRLKEIRNSDLPHKLAETLKGRYSDITPVSVGGMGVVAYGWDLKNKRKVAIKTVLPDLENDPRVLKLFYDECNAIKRMNHPNIVKIFEVSGEGELCYYIMEYLEGENLNSRLKRSGRLPADMTVSIGLQTARAVQHCHDNRVIHRDIKPSNIFITRDETVKIIDFGIVKLVTGDTAVSAGTTKIGSPEFASPEQIQGQKISGKSDIYSTGVTMFFMLSGAMPYKSCELIVRMFDKPADIGKICPEIAADLAEIINQCLSLDPSKRPSGMQLWQRLKALDMRPAIKKP